MNMRLYMPQNQGVSFNQGGGGGQLQLASNYDPFEDELRRRMEAARAQGWNEDEINRSALIERGVRRAQQQRQQQQQAQPEAPKKKTSGRGGFLTSLISEGTATGGAAAGAMAGTAVLPGIGTVIGGALGGLAGGLFGSAAEQQVRDDEINWKKAAGEGAFSAIPGGTGKVVKTLKGAKAAPVKDELADLFAPQPGGVSQRAVQTATNMRADVRGVSPQASVQGRASKRLMPSEADEINDFLNMAGTKGSAQAQLQQIEQVQKAAARQINEVVSGAPKPVVTDDLYKAQNKIRARLIGENGNGVGGFDAAVHGPIANRYAAQMANIQDSQGWLNFKRTLDNDINYSRSTQGVDPKIEQIAETFRREAKEQLERLHPDIKAPNAIYGQAQDAINVLVRQAQPKGLKIGSGFVDFGGNGVGGNARQAGKDLFARNAQGMRGTRPMTDQFGRQVIASTAANMMIGDQRPEDPAQTEAVPMEIAALFDNPQSQDEAILNELFASGGMTDFDSAAQGFAQMQGMADAGGQQAGMQYSSEELMNMAMEAMFAGDAASYKQLATAAEMALEMEQQGFDMQLQQAKLDSKAGGGKLSAEASKVVGNANSGLQSLAQLEALIAQGGVPKGTIVPGRNLLGGAGSNLLGTGSFDVAARNVKDVITRLRTGAAITQNEERFYNAQIPQAFDSPQVIQQKLALFRDLFQSVSSRTGSSDVEDELAQLFAGGGQAAYGY